MNFLRLTIFFLASFGAGLQSASANTVNLEDYGFTENVIVAAKCVQKRMPSYKTPTVAHRYWKDVTFFKGMCQLPRYTLEQSGHDHAKKSFLDVYSDCVGRKVVNDEDLFVAKVSNAVAVLAASGVIDEMTGESLLVKFEKGSKECKEKEDKLFAPPKEQIKSKMDAINKKLRDEFEAEQAAKSKK